MRCSFEVLHFVKVRGVKKRRKTSISAVLVKECQRELLIGEYSDMLFLEFNGRTAFQCLPSECEAADS